MNPSSHPGLLRRLLPSLVLVAAAGVASLWPDPFVLDRNGVASMEVWRVWTGHFVHATWAHFAFDVGVGALLLLFAPWRRALLFLPLFVGAAVLAFRPDLDSYFGLSGVLHGLTVLAAVHLIRRSSGRERAVATLLLVAVLAKAVLESLVGLSLFTGSFDMGGAPVHEAHLAGAVGGLCLAGAGQLGRWFTATRDRPRVPRGRVA